MADSVSVYRVEFRHSVGTDTLTDILYPLPIVVGRDSAAGIRLIRKSESEGDRALFVFSPPTTSKSWPLPTDVHYVFNDVVISPNARHFAYVANDSANGNYAIVRELLTGRVVIRGPGGGGCDCDSDMDHARWLASDSVQIAVHRLADAQAWLLLTGKPSKGSFKLDTLRQEPNGH
jgi:hypothetical protein